MEELERGRDVLLFYEKQKWDSVEKYSKRTISGFYAWYTLLVRALGENGFRVHENDSSIPRGSAAGTLEESLKTLGFQVE